ncbi:MAG: thiamine pyrophosphate-dependent dehydrogenase E1 component subunit alpha [Dehalococcoidia bacterium]|jgi:pyruvate dehydrogenase E1 component alpha subunit|nr:thiamine pyrophosphate-dependent dehydrogenase E1 component subunit alpha [Dehalococcoidia bacterium]|tara:strand:+ start:563 stop:1543 length:981 start_codon:yes stop_codon:yes gene_type:complete
MALDKKQLEEMYLRMCRIRYFEEAVIEIHSSGELIGPAHPYIGEEAVAVGACAALEDHDRIAGNHRSHGHPIAKGGDVKKAMAEILGKTGGFCKGKGGSMHLADFSIGILGESGIVASSVPIATGAALASKLSKQDFVSLVFFGDGASNQGACHESMNMAALWDLPVIFMCENNGYAITTSYKNSVSVDHVSDRASAYGMPGVLVDGQDAIAVWEATNEAVLRARAGEGPTLIEAMTYRYEDHSLGLDRIRKSEYRTQGEVEEAMKRDPLSIHRAAMTSHGFATAEECDRIEAKVKLEIEEAVEFARNSPFPEPDDLYDDMWATPV